MSKTKKRNNNSAQKKEKKEKRRDERQGEAQTSGERDEADEQPQQLSTKHRPGDASAVGDDLRAFLAGGARASAAGWPAALRFFGGIINPSDAVLWCCATVG